MELFLSGLASGFDWKSVVEQLADVQRAPQRRLRSEQTNLNNAGNALSRLGTELQSLLTKAKALQETQLYNTRGVSSTDTHVATASAGPSAYSGSYTFTFTRLATVAAQRGGVNAGQGIDANAVLTSAAAGFGVAVSTGRFTVNGQQIQMQEGDTLNDVLAHVSAQTGLTASYDSSADKITLSDAGGNPIILGSASDTSNFLQATRLTNNGTNALTSSLSLGGVTVSATLASARFNAAVTSGSFAINGVAFTVDASKDTVANVLNAINQSAAGVSASYDSVNDRFALTNKVTGDIGFSLAEGTSNFLSAAKLTSPSGGTLVSGQDAEFTVNGGAALTSQTNTLTSGSHGIEGLTVNARSAGSAAINVANDPSPLKQAITDFVEQYNKVQNMVAIQTASSTDEKGFVTAGILAGDPQVAESARTLRSLMASDASGLPAAIKRLESLGYRTDGFSNEISLGSSGALDNALANSINDVHSLFADGAGGIAAQVGNYLENLVGIDGSLMRHRDAAVNQSAQIDEQVGKLEKAVLASRDGMLQSFRTMEKTLAQINQQAAFFTQRFGLT